MEIQRIKKMKTKINSVLEKKLAELEFLIEAFTCSDHDPNIYRKIELGVVFARTLLAAEISSRPMDVEGEDHSEEMFKLGCMAKRLTEIDDFVTSQLNGYDNSLLIEPELGSLEANGGETGSVYSWIESCLDESIKADEEEEEEEEEAEQWLLFQDALSEEKREVKFQEVAAVEEEEVVVVDREVKEKRRVGFRTLVYFGLIGLVCGMISLFGFIGDNLKDDNFLLSPT